MSDSKKQQIIPPHTNARLPAHAVPQPKPSVPSLPANSGSFWGSATTLTRKDTAFVEAHAGFLRARADQAMAMRELVDSRHDLAIAISKLGALPEVCQHEYEKGRRDRLSELRLLDLKYQTDEVHAQISLAAAREILAKYGPQPEEPRAPPPPSPPAGLTPDEVEDILQGFPDVKPEIVRPIIMALSGVLAEKKKA